MREIVMAKASAYFQKRASIDPDSSCLVWVGPMRDHKPMMALKHSPRLTTARYTWGLLYGELTKQDKLRKTCDNARCVNPEHYTLSTIVCANGHAMTEDNVFYCDNKWVNAEGEVKISATLQCKTCHRTSARESMKRSYYRG